MRAEDWGIPMRRTCVCVNDYCTHHQQMRVQWEAAVRTGKAECWRCGKALAPTELFDLGHDDDDRTRYRGPECRPCNRSTSTRRKQRESRWIL